MDHDVDDAHEFNEDHEVGVNNEVDDDSAKVLSFNNDDFGVEQRWKSSDSFLQI